MRAYYIRRIRTWTIRFNCSCGKRQFAFEVRPAQHTYRQWTHLPSDVKKAGKVVEKIPLLLHVSSVSDLPRGIRKKVVEMRRRILIPNVRTDQQTDKRRDDDGEKNDATQVKNTKAKTSNASEERRKANRCDHGCNGVNLHENTRIRWRWFLRAISSQHFRALFYLRRSVASAHLLTTWQRRRGALFLRSVLVHSRNSDMCNIMRFLTNTLASYHSALMHVIHLPLWCNANGVTSNVTSLFSFCRHFRSQDGVLHPIIRREMSQEANYRNISNSDVALYGIL